jgi:hypothetical protein
VSVRAPRFRRGSSWCITQTPRRWTKRLTRPPPGQLSLLRYRCIVSGAKIAGENHGGEEVDRPTTLLCTIGSLSVRRN